MPKAFEVAAELRKLADSLDKEPEAEISRPWLDFYCHADRGEFLILGKTLPRPFQKLYEGRELKLRYDHPAFRVDVHVERDKVCTLVKPAQEAVYECEPILSDEELDAIPSAADLDAVAEEHEAAHATK